MGAPHHPVARHATPPRPPPNRPHTGTQGLNSGKCQVLPEWRSRAAITESAASLRSGSWRGRDLLLPVDKPHPLSAVLSPPNGHNAYLTFLIVVVKLLWSWKPCIVNNNSWHLWSTDLVPGPVGMSQCL